MTKCRYNSQNGNKHFRAAASGQNLTLPVQLCTRTQARKASNLGFRANEEQPVDTPATLFDGT